LENKISDTEEDIEVITEDLTEDHITVITVIMVITVITVVMEVLG